MATAVIMPRQGNTVESCLLLEWKKSKGDEVNKGDIICEVETDKAVFEIEAPESGKLLDTFFEEGDDIPVLTNIAVIGVEGEDYDDLRPAGENKTAEEVNEPEEKNEPSQQKEPDTTKLEAHKETIPDAETTESKHGVSPRARRLAAKEGIDAGNLTGSGPLHRVIERDVRAVMENREPLTPAAKDLANAGAAFGATGSGIGGRVTSRDVMRTSENKFTEERVREEKIKGVRKIIAERMLDSLQTTAQLTLNSSADASSLLSLRRLFKNSKLDERFAKVNINDLLMYAVVKTLPKHPIVNSLMIKDTIRYYENIHLGFAVDTERGLMVPTIKNAQNLSLLELSNEIKRLSSACRENKIQVEELSGATFTVTNLGNMGIDDFTPVLNTPQTAILGVSRVNLKPVQVEGEVQFIPHLGLSLTINHQVVDGADGARFLMDLATAIKEINLLVAL